MDRCVLSIPSLMSYIPWSTSFIPASVSTIVYYVWRIFPILSVQLEGEYSVKPEMTSFYNPIGARCMSTWPSVLLHCPPLRVAFWQEKKPEKNRRSIPIYCPPTPTPLQNCAKILNDTQPAFTLGAYPRSHQACGSPYCPRLVPLGGPKAPAARRARTFGQRLFGPSIYSVPAFIRPQSFWAVVDGLGFR